MSSDPHLGVFYGYRLKHERPWRVNCHGDLVTRPLSDVDYDAQEAFDDEVVDGGDVAVDVILGTFLEPSWAIKIAAREAAGIEIHPFGFNYQEHVLAISASVQAGDSVVSVEPRLDATMAGWRVLLDEWVEKLGMDVDGEIGWHATVSWARNK